MTQSVDHWIKQTNLLIYSYLQDPGGGVRVLLLAALFRPQPERRAGHFTPIYCVSYRTLVAVSESYFSPHYFDHSLIGAQADQAILKDLVQDKLQSLSGHLEGLDIELSTVTLNWFLAIFFDAVPFQVCGKEFYSVLTGPNTLRGSYRFALVQT